MIHTHRELRGGDTKKLPTYQVMVSWLMIFDGSKSAQPIFIDVHSQRVTGGHQYINTQVKLETIHNEWLQAQMVHVM